MTPAVERLDRLGIAHEVLTYHPDPAAVGFGLEAASALGLDPRTVFKTLVVEGAGIGLAVAIVPVSHQLDLKAVARALQGKKVAMAGRRDAERSTGYVLGGISPLGQKKRLRTVLDCTASDWGRIHVSGGRRGVEIALAPEDLITATAAVTAPIALNP